jgi:hypothetical protein
MLAKVSDRLKIQFTPILQRKETSELEQSADDPLLAPLGLQVP